MNLGTKITSIVVGVILGGFVVLVPKTFAYYSQELISNGGFEADPVGTGWVLTPNTTQSIGAFSGTSWHGGSRGVKLGYGLMDALGGAQLTQSVYGSMSTIAVPSNAKSVTFTAWYNIISDELYIGTDSLVVSVYNNSDVTQKYCEFTIDAAQVVQSTWTNVSCDLSPAKGKQLNVTVRLTTDKVDPTIANVDDISIVADFFDVTAPVTSMSASPTPGTSGYYTTAPTITLSAVDDVGGSGLSGTVYGWDAPGNTSYTAPFVAPEGSHVLYYSSTDKAGVAETTKTAGFKVDTSLPTIAISSPGLTDRLTKKEVTVQGTVSDPVGVSSVTVNGIAATLVGGTNYSAKIVVAYGANTVAVTAVDAAGNANSMVSAYAFKNPLPVITTLTTTKPSNTYTITVNNKKVVLKPFVYRGNVWGRKIDFGTDFGVVYIFGSQDTGTKGGLVMFDKNGKQLASFNPFGAGSVPPTEYQMVIQRSSDMIFLVVTSKKDASQVKTFEVTRKGFTNVGTLKTGQKANTGQVVSQFLKMYDGDYGLVTALASKVKTIKVWKYDSVAKRFSQDKAPDLSVIKLSGAKITHR